MSETNVIAPANPAIDKDLKAWENAVLQTKIDQQMLKQLIAMVATMSNPLMGCQLVMEMMGNVQSDKVSGLAAAGNVGNDIRNAFSGDQSDFNAGDKASVDQMKDWLDDFGKMKAFLDEQKAKGNDAVMSPAAIDNLETAMDSIKTQFGSDWGNAAAMQADMKSWVKESHSGKPSDELKAIQSGFQTMNQSVSAFATTTNTNLQFQTEQYKQFLGIFNNINSMFLKFVGTMVRNQRAN